MKVIRAQVTLERDSALPADVITNTWHWYSGTSTTAGDTEAIALGGALSTFYGSISTRLSAVFTGVGNVDFYDLADPQPRVPFATYNMTTFTPNTTALPSEVALCLSYEAVPVSGVPQSRRRGRVYIGPLAVATSAVSGVGNDCRPTGACVSNLLSAAAAMTPVTVGADTWSLAVYSPTQFQAQGGDAGDSTNPVYRFWVDDAFDTQRRRGAPITTRTYQLA